MRIVLRATKRFTELILMTNDQAKQAFLKQCPVMDNNPINRDRIIYKCISVIGFKMIQGKPVMFCRRQDRHTDSSTVVLPQYISEYKGECL